MALRTAQQYRDGLRDRRRRSRPIPTCTCGPPYAAGERDGFSFPLSSKHKLLESLTVFDDVRIPGERVFLERRPRAAGPLAIAFVDYHRFTAISYKLPLLDIVVGAAHLVAEANGITRAGHVRDKIAKLIAWSETVRGLAGWPRCVTARAPRRSGCRTRSP